MSQMTSGPGAFARSRSSSEPPVAAPSLSWSVVGMALLAQVHGLLQCLTCLLGLFAHLTQSFANNYEYPCVPTGAGCLLGSGGATRISGAPRSATHAGSPRRVG